jgi:hypothetical protein
MIARDLRNTLASIDGSLDDVRREAIWRTIDRELADPAELTAPWPWRRFAVATLSIAVVAAVAIAWLRPAAQPRLTQPSLVQSTELVAEAGQTTRLERDGTTLTLVGPGAVSITPERDGTLRIQISRGTLLAERTDDAPALAIAAGSNTTVTRDRMFAVHVSPTTVILGAGAVAKQIIERELVRDVSPPTEPIEPTEPPSTQPSSADPPARSPRGDVPAPARASATDVYVPPRSPAVTELRVDAPELYRLAEVAMQKHDPNGARELLERLRREFPDHVLVDAARYDLALLALAAGDRGKARALVDEIILSGRDPAVRTAAETLRARIK